MWLYRPFPINLWWNPKSENNHIDMPKKNTKKYDAIFDGLVPHQHIQLIQKLTIQIAQSWTTLLLQELFENNPYQYYKKDVYKLLYEPKFYSNSLERKYSEYFKWSKDIHHIHPRSQWWAIVWINTIERNIQKHAQFHHFFTNAYYNDQLNIILAIQHSIYKPYLLWKLRKITQSPLKKLLIPEAFHSVLNSK